MDIGHHEHPAIERVRKGMTVIDVSGDEVGSVEFVKLGDPESATVSQADLPAAETPHETPIVAAPGVNSSSGVVAAPIVPVTSDLADTETVDSNLLRSGFLRVDAKGWFNSDLMVPADAIASVDGETVYLSVVKDGLTKA